MVALTWLEFNKRTENTRNKLYKTQQLCCKTYDVCVFSCNLHRCALTEEWDCVSDDDFRKFFGEWRRCEHKVESRLWILTYEWRNSSSTRTKCWQRHLQNLLVTLFGRCALWRRNSRRIRRRCAIQRRSRHGRHGWNERKSHHCSAQEICLSETSCDCRRYQAPRDVTNTYSVCQL